MATGLNKENIKQSIKRLGVGFISVFLASCGAIQSKNIEEMIDYDRVVLLSSQSDADLCSAYNHPLLKPKTEQQIEKILRDRQIGRCDARSKVRIIPLSVTSTELASSSKNDGLVLSKVPSESSTPSSVVQPSPVITAPEKKAEQAIPVVFGDKNSFLADIKAMQGEKLSKGDFESKAEYELRKQAYSDQFKKGRGYKISFDIDNPQNKKEKLVYFDPDSEVIRISLPSISRDLVWINSGGKEGLKWLHNSFIQIESMDHKLKTYTAKNRLGASIEVVEMGITRYGFAILSQATKDYGADSRQRFSTPFNRGDAKEILETGKIVMEVVFDPRYPLAKDNPFLIKNEDKTKPTFDRPIDVTDIRYAVPVRLLNIRLLNKAGKEVFAASGRQIDVESLTD
ncbi:hypothetical protein [Limnohabitans sp. MMS-10A-178]|jgi:hypothetical protein|uniref:hypothetical protein n=1 Tax=Limnohabitans sp. MMS-10A-178 TaxID=1835767 RepID=UPI000D368A8D|nr:hypothetical protein [Limnohabitans sp. MMS-10A-178]PUE13735.1 hypothetical protein B9Z32_13885 [Limnohabitans sp. MMS-10A-178]